MLAMTSGQVQFFNFITGDHIYTLNTHEVYQFPSSKISEAIEMCARTYWYDLILQNKCEYHAGHSHDESEGTTESYVHSDTDWDSVP